MSQTTLAIKLSAAAATCVTFAPAAEGVVVASTSLPVSTTLGGSTVTWDIDGDGFDDFRLRPSIAIGNDVFLDSTGLNGRGWLNTTSATSGHFTRLFAGQVIGAGGNFDESNYGFRDVLSFSSTRSVGGARVTFAIPGYDFDGATDGDNFAGFRFMIGGNTHYGYAVFNLDLDNKAVSIVSAFYNDEAGASVTIPVPEPASGLALLAAGAAGLTTWRRRRGAAQK